MRRVILFGVAIGATSFVLASRYDAVRDASGMCKTGPVEHGSGTLAVSNVRPEGASTVKLSGTLDYDP